MFFETCLATDNHVDRCRNVSTRITQEVNFRPRYNFGVTAGVAQEVERVDL